ncbi:hypothetical protein [Haloarchaeobius sp. DT45]|uniref:hypothetical protein n=1 Tax=Haloarchaeobius sp. DT45 TaxID=3446116 RepID=UPI003F6ABB5C
MERDVDWTDVGVFYLDVEEKAGTAVGTEPTNVDIGSLDENLFRIDTRFASIRELTYDYEEQNFRVRELNGELHFTRHPEPSSRGFLDRLKGLF